MAQAVQTAGNIANPIRTLGKRRWLTWDWLGVVPFFAFAFAFQLYPALSIIIRSFTDSYSNLTLKNIEALNQPVILSSYLNSIQLSLFTALGGGLLGFLLAYTVTIGGLPRWLRSSVLTFCGVASNFAGIPLAFAFIATIGQLGLITKALKSVGISLYPSFSLYSFWGLCVTYIYFQLPLMVLIIAPALDGLRREWREASESLGATHWQYWRYVAMPILLPSILGTMALYVWQRFWRLRNGVCAARRWFRDEYRNFADGWQSIQYRWLGESRSR